MLRKVAITGPIASGKSLALKLFKTDQIYIFSADHRVTAMMRKKSIIGKSVVKILGKEVLDPKKPELKRDVIASVIFHDEKKRQALEGLIHPKVYQEMQIHMQIAHKQEYRIFIAEIPLLFELGWERYFDEVVLIDAAMKDCVRRFCQRKKMSLRHAETAYLQRARLYKSIELKRAQVDKIIENDGKFSTFKSQLIQIRSALLRCLS